MVCKLPIVWKQTVYAKGSQYRYGVMAYVTRSRKRHSLLSIITGQSLNSGRALSCFSCCEFSCSWSDSVCPETEKIIMIWRALHEYANFVHGPEKPYRSLLPRTGLICLGAAAAVAPDPCKRPRHLTLPLSPPPAAVESYNPYVHQEHAFSDIILDSGTYMVNLSHIETTQQIFLDTVHLLARRT